MEEDQPLLAKACYCFFDVRPSPRTPLSLGCLERGQVLEGTWVWFWALLIDCLGEGAPLGMLLLWVLRVQGLLQFIMLCSTLSPGCVRGCYEAGGCHAHLKPLEGLFRFNDSSIMSWFRLKGIVLVILIWRCICTTRLILEPPHCSRLTLWCFHLLTQALDNHLLNLSECLIKLLHGDKLWNQRPTHQIFFGTQCRGTVLPNGQVPRLIYAYPYFPTLKPYISC